MDDENNEYINYGHRYYLEITDMKNMELQLLFLRIFFVFSILSCIKGIIFGG